MSTSIGWLTAVAIAVAAVGTLLTGLVPFLLYRKQLREERKRKSDEQPQGAAAVPTPDAHPARFGESATWSAGSGLAAWGVALIVVILVASTTLSLRQAPLVAFIIVVWGLAGAAVVFGVRALIKAGSHGEHNLAQRAQSGLLAALGATFAMLIIII